MAKKLPAREVVAAVLIAARAPLSRKEIIAAAAGHANAAAIDMALMKGTGTDFVRTGEPFHYRYAIAEDAVPPPVANDDPAGTGGLAPSVGTRCNVVPENPSQGTIEQALRGVLSEDAPLPLDEVLRQLPIGWSRTEAISGLKEAALDGWASYGPDGWQLVGEPPAPPAADPASVRAIPNHMHLRLQEVDGQVREQLRDAVTLGHSPFLCAALANASAELNKALALIDA